MSNKKRILPILVLAFAGLTLAACGEDNTTQAEDPTTENTTQDTEPTTDDQSPDITETSDSSDDTTSSDSTTEEFVFNSISITNKEELTAFWDIDDGNKAVVVETDPVVNYTQAFANGDIVLSSSNPEVFTVSGKYIHPVGLGTATVTATAGEVSDSVEITIDHEDKTVVTLQSVREGIASGDIKANDEVTFNAQLVGYMNPASDQLYNGVYVADGDYGIMLYSGKIDEFLLDKDGNLVYEIGTNLKITGVLSPYNGLNEIKPSAIEATTAEIAAPTALALTADNWSAEGLAGQDGRMVIAENLKYVKGTVSTEASKHSTVYFALEGADGNDVEVPVYVNYHIGADQVAAVADIVNNLEAGDLVTIKAFLSWYNNPQISLGILDGVAPATAIVKTGHATLPDPESISVDPTELELSVGQTAKITPTVLPANSNQTVTFSSNNEEVATVSSEGVVTAVATGTTTIVAASAKEGLTAETTVVVTDNNFIQLKSEPVEGTAYKLGLYQGNLEKYLFANNTMSGKFISSSENIYKSADYFVEPLSEESNEKSLYTLVEGEKQYIVLTAGVNNKGALTGTLSLSSTLSTLFVWDEELLTYKTLLEYEGVESAYFYLGTYSTYATFSASNVSYAATSYVSHWYTMKPEVVVNTADELAENTPYILGLEQGNLNNARLYFKGTITEKGFLETTEDPNEAVNTYLVAREDKGYNFFFFEGEVAKYINLTPNATASKCTVSIDSEGTTPWEFNNDYSTLVFNAIVDAAEDNFFYIGTYNSYNTLSASKISYAATSFVSHLMHNIHESEIREPVDENEFEALLKSNVTANTNGAELGNGLTEALNLDTNIFSVSYDKNGAQNDMAVRTDGIRMYATKSTANGNKITVSVTADYVIKSIEIAFDSGYSSTAEVIVDNEVVAGEDGVYAINASAFTLFNNNSNVSSNTQVRFQSIKIVYGLAA